MIAVELRSYGVNALAVTTRPTPNPKGREVLVKVHAVSLNKRDLLVVGGVDRWRPQLPRILLSDELHAEHKTVP